MNIMHNVIMNSTCSQAIAAYGNIAVRQGKFQKRTIVGSNNDASLEVSSCIARHVLYLPAVIINLNYVPIAFSKRILFKKD